MKIYKGTFAYYYTDSKTNEGIFHGFLDDHSFKGWGIGYNYHGEKKGFWLRKKRWL